MTIAETIDSKYGSLSKFAEAVWDGMPGLSHGHKADSVWIEVTKVAKELLGDEDGQAASDLLREQGFFSIVFPD